MFDVFRCWEPCRVFVLFVVLPEIFESFFFFFVRERSDLYVSLSCAERQGSIVRYVLTRSMFSL